MEANRGFLVPVELRFIDENIGHGVFCLNAIGKGQNVWIPNMVKKIHFDELSSKLECMTAANANEFLRQGFVLANDLDHLCVNVDDLGRYTNHSAKPNVGYADFSSSQSEISIALRDITAGEELTCDYSGLGSPLWYKILCSKYNVLSTDVVAKL